MRLGLKLWSTDTGLSRQAQERHADGLFDYIELYVVPGSVEATADLWSRSGLPFLLHAPHAGHGVNLAERQLEATNRAAMAEVQRLADLLAADTIIVHPGCDGTLAETIRQLRLLDDSRIQVENKPRLGLGGQSCRGYSAGEIGQILAAGVAAGLVLDFGHAVCAARSLGQDPLQVVGDLAGLSPRHFHLADGWQASEIDVHLNLGQGDLPVGELVAFLPRSCWLSLETPRRPDSGLDDFVRDVHWLRSRLRPAVSAIGLRPATWADRHLLLAWRNTDEARQASRHSRLLDRQEHERWLGAVLADPARRISVAEENGLPVGMVRADAVDHGWELSWIVAPRATGRGIGKRMLAQLAATMPGVLRAVIKPGNQASIRMAEAIGMSCTGREGDLLLYVRPAGQLQRLAG
ncbi:MAG: GNAT family N-acetyltransferase [Thermodesulfobacteriota bacterium]